MAEDIAGFVFIMESPSSEDLLDGRTEGRALSEALRLSGTDSWYCMVTSRKMLFRALQERLVAAINHFPKKNPILHFSMHGNQDGVGLTNGDFISWTELRAALASLNNAMDGGLLICMSSCFGGSGCRMAMHEDDEQPFWSLVGNENSASWSDAAVAYVTFYHKFFKGCSVLESVEAMRIASGDPNFVYYNGHRIKAGWAEQMAKIRGEGGRQIMVNALANVPHVQSQQDG